MYIEREGKRYELTQKELFEAYTVFRKSWMRSTLEEDFDIPENISQKYADWAFDLYSEGNGKTEYECLELAVKEFGNAHESDDELQKATCAVCNSCNSGYCDRFQGPVDADDDCEHIHADFIKKIYAFGYFLGYYNVENFDAKQIAQKLGYGLDVLQILDTI